MLTRRSILVLPAVAFAQDEAPKKGGWRKATDAEMRTAGQPAAEAPTGDVVFRAEVRQVRVDAEVYDSAGVIQGLQRTDFRVFDNSQERDVADSSQDELPLDILLLFDVSGSMRPAIQRVADSASEAFAQLKKGDRVAVMSFHSDSRLLLSFTSNLDRVGDVIDQRILGGHFGGGTLIQNAVADATEVFQRDSERNRRRAIVVITDNEGQRTRREEGLLTGLWEADVTLCGLLVGAGYTRRMRIPRGVMSPGSIPIDLALRVGVDGLAEKSGGELVPGENPHAFAGLMKRLRQRYAIYYSMPTGTAGEQRQVRVDLADAARARHPQARVRCRKGYVIPA
jgi:VWFA-related protein